MCVSHVVRRILLAASAAIALASPAVAQAQSGNWQVSVYPVLAWLPTNVGIEVNVPVDDGSPGNGSGGGDGDVVRGEILDSRFDGAFLGGFSATNGTWRIDADGLWAAVGGDRPDSPTLTVDADVIYGHASVGLAVYKDLFVTAGVRRLALKYDIQIADVARFTRKPGLWDPLVGAAYHHVGEKFEAHGVVDVGGFGVGSDSEFGATVRVDWKPVRHFGLTGGYSYLRFKFKDDVANRTLEATQTLSGPVAGIGLYF
jgi:hypothetical protein